MGKVMFWWNHSIKGVGVPPKPVKKPFCYGSDGWREYLTTNYVTEVSDSEVFPYQGVCQSGPVQWWAFDKDAFGGSAVDWKQCHCDRGISTRVIRSLCNDQDLEGSRSICIMILNKAPDCMYYSACTGMLKQSNLLLVRGSNSLNSSSHQFCLNCWFSQSTPPVAAIASLSLSLQKLPAESSVGSENQRSPLWSPRVSPPSAGSLTATRISWQHSHFIELRSCARHKSMSQTTTHAHITKCQSIRSKWKLPADCRASRPNTDSVTSQCHGLRHPSRPCFSLFISVTCYWRRHAAGHLSRHFASFEENKTRLSSKWVKSVTSDARLAVMGLGWATGICLEIRPINNCFKWTNHFKGMESKSNAKKKVLKFSG